MKLGEAEMRCPIISVVVIVVLGCVCLGCKPPNPMGRIGVSGTVTFNGQPVKSGSINFGPRDQSGNITFISGAIIDGEYSFDDHKGVVAGEYGVTISIPDPNYNPERDGSEQESVEPPDWNNMDNHIVKVTEDGPNVFNFDVVNPNPPEYHKKSK
jgi:hypothetical protein